MSSLYIDLLGCETRYYQTAKYRTRSIEAGTGDVLFLMHGGGGHAEAYAKNVRRLGQHFRVMAIDSIWHGFSSAPPFPEKHWVKEFTRHVIDLMDHLKIEKASFEGESLTGWIAIDMALHHPERVNKIILNNQALGAIIMNRRLSPLDHAATSASNRTAQLSNGKPTSLRDGTTRASWN